MNPRDTLIALSHVVLCSFRTGTLVTRNSHASLLCRRRFALLHSRCYTRSEFVLHLSPRPTSFSVYPGHSHCYNDSVHLWLVYFGSHTFTLALIAFYTLSYILYKETDPRILYVSPRFDTFRILSYLRLFTNQSSRIIYIPSLYTSQSRFYPRFTSLLNSFQPPNIRLSTYIPAYMSIQSLFYTLPPIRTFFRTSRPFHRIKSSLLYLSAYSWPP